MGRAPTRSYRKGDPIYPPKNMKPRPYGGWMIDAGKEWTKGDKLDEEIQNLLHALPSDPALWAELDRRFDLDVCCGAVVTDTSPGVGLEKETLKMLADRHLRFEICIYLDLDSIRDHLDKWSTADDHHPVTK